MKVVSPGKFEVTIGGETRVILVSLGLKTELYKLITKAQLDMAALNSRVYLDEDMSKLIQEKDAEVKRLENEEAAEETIQSAKEELDELYGRALQDLEARQSAAFNDTVIQRIDMSERIMADAISCLLSERDEYGKVVNKLEPDVIMWSPTYAEAQEELTELLYAVTEYITSALKKISGINALVQNVDKPDEPAKKDQEKSPT